MIKNYNNPKEKVKINFNNNGLNNKCSQNMLPMFIECFRE